MSSTPKHEYSDTPSAGDYSSMHYEMPFTPLLPSQLLMGSPFQPGTPAMAQFASFPGPPGSGAVAAAAAAAAAGQYGGYPYYAAAAAAAAAGMENARTVYLGNVPSEATAEELLNHVRSGVIENVRMMPEKNCVFVSFLDHASAAHFHSDAILKKLAIRGNDIKIGWGRSYPVPAQVQMAVSQDGASRNVYLGHLPDDVTEEDIRNDLGQFGPIDTVKLVRDKNIAFVHFLNIATAVKAVHELPQNAPWDARKVFYGKDRCAYVSKTQQQNAAQYLGIPPGSESIIAKTDREMLTSALAQQSAAAVAVATTAGGASNVGNRTIYLGNIHPETSTEEICNVVRGGLLHHIRYIPERHICFVTFVDPTAAAQFFAMASLYGVSIHNRRLKVGWGKHSGPLPNAISLAVTAGASRNVYIGNIDESWPEAKLRRDFSEFGDVEQINFLPEKSCAFVNFTDITNAIKAIEGIKEKGEYRQFKVNFGKDRCGNPPRLQLYRMAQQAGGAAAQQLGDDASSAGDSDGGGTPGPNGHANGHANGHGRYDMNSPAVASTFGSHMLAQYLAHAQHEQYMYAAAVAAAADGQQQQQQQYEPQHHHHHHQQHHSVHHDQGYTYETRRKSDSSLSGGGDESPSPAGRSGRDEENGSATPATSVTATSPRGAATSSDTTVGDVDEADLKRLESLSLGADNSNEKVYGLAIEST